MIMCPSVPPEEFENKLRTVYKELDLQDKLHEWYQRLSRGYRQALWIAAAYIINPELLILDELAVHLDPLMESEVLSIIKELIKENKTTVLYTSHKVREVDKICDKVMFLNKRIMFEGSPKELKLLAMYEERGHSLLNSRIQAIFRGCNSGNRACWMLINSLVRRSLLLQLGHEQAR